MLSEGWRLPQNRNSLSWIDVNDVYQGLHPRGSDSLPRPSTQVPPETRIISGNNIKRTKNEQIH